MRVVVVSERNRNGEQNKQFRIDHIFGPSLPEPSGGHRQMASNAMAVQVGSHDRVKYDRILTVASGAERRLVNTNITVWPDMYGGWSWITSIRPSFKSSTLTLRAFVVIERGIDLAMLPASM